MMGSLMGYVGNESLAKCLRQVRQREERGGGETKSAYTVRECDDDDDAAVFSCSLFHNRDLYAGQVLKFQALTRKLEFQRVQVS